MRKMIMLVGIALVVLLVGGISVNKFIEASRDKPIYSVSDVFVKDMLNYQPTTSYKLFSKKAQAAYSYLSWQADTNALSTFFDGSKASRSGMVVSGSGRTVDYKVKGSDGMYIIALHMVTEDGAWRVQSYESSLAGSK